MLPIGNEVEGVWMLQPNPVSRKDVVSLNTVLWSIFGVRASSSMELPCVLSHCVVGGELSLTGPTTNPSVGAQLLQVVWRLLALRPNFLSLDIYT